MKVTADTLTDKHIAAVRDWAARLDATSYVDMTFKAQGPSDMFWDWQQPTPDEVRRAREHCARLFNVYIGGPL